MAGPERPRGATSATSRPRALDGRRRSRWFAGAAGVAVRSEPV